MINRQSNVNESTTEHFSDSSGEYVSVPLFHVGAHNYVDTGTKNSLNSCMQTVTSPFKLILCTDSHTASIFEGTRVVHPHRV